MLVASSADSGVAMLTSKQPMGECAALKAAALHLNLKTFKLPHGCHSRGESAASRLLSAM